VAEPRGSFPAVAQRINPEIFLETAEMVSEIRTSPDVTAKRRSNRVGNLKRALYIDNARVGGWFEVPCRVEQAGKYSLSVFQCLYRTGGIWKVTLAGPAGEILLDRGMDFYDPYLAWKENRPENLLYGTWFEKKLGIHQLAPGDYVFRFECVGANPLSRANDSDEPGLHCRLDGISLRRFPWEDLYGDMQRYLAEEEKRFAEMVARARQSVADLAAAVERFRLDTGEYPSGLDELQRRPQRLPTGAGKWPYVTELATDPWGQAYRYACPGQFNPGGFDVYSVHGNSRNPALWIGNWPSPYRLRDSLEGEDLEIQAKSDAVTVTKQEIGIASFPPLSGGRLLFVRLQKKGDSIDLALPRSIKPGKYVLKLRLITSWDYAVVRVSFNGQPLGSGLDTHSPKVDAMWTEPVQVEIGTQPNVLRLEAVNQNPFSSGFHAGLDALVLTPVR